MLPIQIRRMERADLEKVLELDQRSFILPWPASSFKFELNHNEVSRCWVVEVSPEAGSPVLAGMAVVWMIIDEVHIATIAVHPEYRGRKIAQRFLAFILLDAYHAGATRSFLEVRRGNLPARTLYERFGYVETGVRRNYYKDNGEDAIMMELEKVDPIKLESFR